MASNPVSLNAHTEELAGQKLALISSSASAVLASAKILVGIQAHSSSVVSDGLEAAGDVLCSMIVYIGLWIASKPPDKEHPYGHGRYETLAGLAVGAFLLLAGAGILAHAWSGSGTNPSIRSFALYPLLAAFVIKLGLAGVKFRVGKRIDSLGLQSDAWHDVTDLLSTTVASVAVLLTLFNPAHFRSADRIGSIIIGIIVLSLSLQVVRRTTLSLVDTMPEPARMDQIRAAALSVPGARGIEKCFARRSGLRYYVDLHLEVDPYMTVRESHEIATGVREAVKQRLPWVADVLVHVEPSDMRTPGVDAKHSTLTHGKS
jgi:cation diffusion facilitator family transporter